MAASRSIGKYILIAVVIVLIVWVGSAYNRIVSADENVDTAWRQVETQYQRRIDLIPNVVNTVKGTSNFEQETLTAVTEARTQWLGAGGNRNAQVEATNNVESALSRLLVTVESYPTLKSTKAYEDLIVELEGSENRISTARLDYNLAVKEYNLIVRRFPGNVVSLLFGYEAAEGFQAAEGAEDAPVVDFNEAQ